ncbi:hypothetical protein J6590_101699 [Homalodisca vitripennis]|nr:hypothetical protein J6590_101699 [Homalodisca vitripennis]
MWNCVPQPPTFHTIYRKLQKRQRSPEILYTAGHAATYHAAKYHADAYHAATYYAAAHHAAAYHVATYHAATYHAAAYHVATYHAATYHAAAYHGYRKRSRSATMSHTSHSGNIIQTVEIEFTVYVCAIYGYYSLTSMILCLPQLIQVT